MISTSSAQSNDLAPLVANKHPGTFDLFERRLCLNPQPATGFPVVFSKGPLTRRFF